jgi:hypothetical protein
MSLPDSRVTMEKETSTIEYLFTGKLTLFPLAILFLGIGAGVLLRYGDKPYLHGYFQSVEMYYGIAGLGLAILAFGFFFALMLCIVLKISFTMSPEVFTIKKHGVFRSAKLEFDMAQISLHYFRTHFSDEEAWLQLVVKEGTHFYQIFSWKGKGSQKDRFLKLFVSLQRELIKWQNRANRYRLMPKKEYTSTEIVSKKEVNLISPFRHRLQVLADTQKMNKFFHTRTGRAVCIEDIPVINYDKFFSHFSGKKSCYRLAT